MAINGIKRLIYGVEDFSDAVRFFTDFGLSPSRSDRKDGGALFALPNGATVGIFPLGHPALAEGGIEGPGVREVVWGVDSQAACDTLAADLATDHSLDRLEERVRFRPFFGVPMALEPWVPAPVACAPEAGNAPGVINRLNTHRRWRRHARPKVINHVVFRIAAYEAAASFMRRRLGFRLSDIQQGFGHYLRADGCANHHNILFLNANAPYTGCDGSTRFDHANFGVEDLDELMIGANNMVLKGWEPSRIGLGRHRVDSALFYYMESPAGGEAEYGADGDYIDDSWVPRNFHVPLFAYSHFTHNIPEFLRKQPEWAFSYLTEAEVAASLDARDAEHDRHV